MNASERIKRNKFSKEDNQLNKTQDYFSESYISELNNDIGSLESWKSTDELGQLRKKFSTVMLDLYRANDTSEQAQKLYNSVKSARDYLDNVSNEYSKYASADEYNAQMKLYEDQQKHYENLANSSEATFGWEKYLADLEASKQAENAEKEDEKWYEAIGRYLYGSGGSGTADSTLPTSNVSVAVGAIREDDSYKKPQDTWSEKQKQIFGALYMSNPDEAYQYAIYTNNLNNKAAEAEKIRKIQESATSNFGAGIGHTVGAIATAPLGLADYLNNLAHANAGRPISSDGIVSPFEYSQSVTGGISSKLNKEYGTLDENIPIFGGKGLGDIYGLGTSVAQSMASAYTLGGIGTLVSYFGQGAASGVDDALSRGASDEQALLYGTVVGVLEGVFEEIGVERLFKLGSASTLKGVTKNIFNQAMTEGAEEFLTSIGSNIADDVIDRFYQSGTTNFDILVKEYISKGMSKSEASRYAWLKIIGVIAFDTIAGAASGGISGTIHTTAQNIYANKQATQLYSDSTADLVSEALDLNPNNKYAQKMQNKLESGKKLSGGQINRLIDENEDIIRNSAKVEETSDDSQTNTTDTDSVESPYPTPQNTVQETETTTISENTTAEENATESEFKASEDVSENETVDNAATLEEASKKYGAQAQAMIHTYNKGQNVYKYDSAYKTAYDMGKSGVSLSYAKSSTSTAYLTDSQKELAYEAGKAAADTTAQEQDAKNKSLANGKIGRKKGTVKGEGVTISDLRKSFNDTQNKAYKILSTYAEATGIDIVLYKSETDEDGNFIGSQGKFKWKEDTIYIDVNAGLTNIKDVNDLAKYTMLRTFSHEFTHFIEKWNPIWYNEFRKVVFDTLTERGENVHDLIETKMSMSEEMTYDEASREVVAEAMTDILPDANFVETLAANHKNIFDKLFDKLKEFLTDLKEYFKAIGGYSSREAKALKNEIDGAVHYVDNIVKLFDKVALEAVENYQKTVAIEEKTEKIDSIVTNNSENISKSAEKVQKTEEVTPVKEDIAENATTTKEAAPESDKTVDTVGDSFTITDNAEFGTLEIKFDGKPSEDIRNMLKEYKFRWHSKKGVWYGKGERANIVKALREAYQSEGIIEAKETTPIVAEEAATIKNTTDIEEVNQNVEIENADNERPILEPDTDGERASRLLDESQATDVQGASSEGDSLGDTKQRKSKASRNGDRADTADRVSGSNGNGEVGDLRRNDELTKQENQIKAEQLSETVEKEIEQKSTVKPKGDNFVIGDSLNLPNGEKAKFRANVDAIKLIKQLEAEGRYATTSEQEILSKYVGWGGLDKAFGEYRYNRETRKSEMVAKDGWEKEFAELKSLVDEGMITEQEYKDMSASTTNAYYTSIEVIKAMYDGLASLGFKGGRMLEPSSGVGNFVGAMPTDMTAKVNSWTMVELDRITGLIAKYLYPNADVRIQGFENANIPDNYMDVAIGNVPFGNFGVIDKSYPNRITKAIHNYFFAKSIDKVRPGGIVMFITSSFTMNSENTAIRQYIMDRADLLGAIRLPNTAFKGNAGTEVVADILVLKKRESGTQYAGEDFLNADYDSNYGTYTSNYFKKHPEMVLGKPIVKKGMYGGRTLTFEPFTDRGTIDEQIRKAFKNIKGKMDYPAKRSPEKTNFAVEKAMKKTKSGGFVVNSDGTISKNENGQLVKYDTDEKTAKRITGMLAIRDAYRTLANYLQQGQDAKYVKQARNTLNKAYDTFVKEYGYINSPTNRKAIDSDPDSYSILSLENYDAKKKTAKKADIFTKDTISANKTITHVDNVSEGVIASINLTGGVDVSLIAKLTDKTAEDVTRDIIDSRLAFKDRNNNLIARETYLSGNVRAKLREAESLVPFDSDYNNNIEELRKVIPTDIPYNEIYITPGATFIPNEIYADFIAHMLGGRNNPNSYSGPDVEVGRTLSGEFKINVNNKRLKNGYYNTQTWGTARKSFLDLIDAMMGSRTIKVNDVFENADGKKVSVVNEAETEAANEKAKAIQKEFEDWIWKDENRRESLARLYNETFNAIVNPKYDGSHLSVNGINAEYSLRPHQANAVHRIISSGGNTLLAHRVGAGKTLEMAAAAMKMRELGVIKKPVFVVPKSVVAQWGVEFHNYFPAARLLVADDKSFTPANRKIFTNKIANGDYDAVIVSYEQFEKIPMSTEYQARFYEEQINEIIDAIAEEKAESRDGKGLTVKEMEKKRSQLDKKLKELTSKPKDENNVDFEMLGIDSLFVDEAHNFKNLEYVSKMTNVAGLGSTKGAQRSFDLYTKIRYLQELNGGRGVVFATATPVMNSMVELYIMQRYLQPDILNQLGLKSFDAWAKQFGEVVNKWEINPSGTGMRQKQVFANFRNLNELQLLFRSFADVLTEVPGLKIPKMKGGAVKIIECEPGEFQKNYMQELQKRAENVKNVDPSEDNMLKITSDGRKVSYTQRMIDPTLPYEPESKIFKAAENIIKEYKDSTDIKGTQIVFLDMATPKGTDKSKADTDTNTTDDGYDEESARLYDDMRNYLVKKGIPKREIAFIHEADSDAKRKQLFEDVNNGKVRVLIGSTGKMGVGMNAQKRVVAIHHLDAPWRPGDVEQRDGRAFRQKNMNDEVSKYVYVTKGSFDSRLWDILDRKQHFINQIMNGEDVGRTAEDTGEVTLSAAEVKALASGNPLIEEQTKLTDEIKKLENLLKAYNSSIRLAKTKLSDDEIKITNFTNRIARIREDIATRIDTYSDGKFSMTVGKQAFSDKKEAGTALAAAIVAKANADSYVTVGKFAGFELRVIKNGAEYNGLIHGKESYKFNIYLNNTTRMVNHIGEIIAGFENMIKNTEQMITETTADRDAQKNILAQPFEKQDELNTKRARFNEVMELLAPKTDEQLGKTDDDTVQEQSRAYLEEDIEQEQQRTNTLTDREVLEIAANEIKVSDLTQAENDALTIFQNRLSKLKDLQAERAEQGRLYKEQQFGETVDRKAAEETLNRMHILDSQIKKATAEVLTVEEKEVLKRVLTKARKVVEAQEREHGKEILNRWRERRDNAVNIKKYKDRILADREELIKWLKHPLEKNVTKHINDNVKDTVINFLLSIDTASARKLRKGVETKDDLKHDREAQDLLMILNNLDDEVRYSGDYDLPLNFTSRLETHIKTVKKLTDGYNGNMVLNRMSVEELRDLSIIIANLKTALTTMNKFHANAMFAHVTEAGNNTVSYLKELRDSNGNRFENFIMWKNIRPAEVWKRFGKGGISIERALRKGQDKLGLNAKVIIDFAKDTFTAKERKSWDTSAVNVTLSDGRNIKLTVSALMSFYELSKRKQGRDHILNGGVTVADVEIRDNKKKQRINGRYGRFTEADIDIMNSKLTDKQKEVADKLQQFMEKQGGEWGNYVTLARFGEKAFGEVGYFPISVDKQSLSTQNTDNNIKGADLYRLLNMGFTKELSSNTKQPLMLYSIFDVFSTHMADMAQYNAMALPVLDAIRWLNYKTFDYDTKAETSNLRAELKRAYGSPIDGKGYAENFIVHILQAYNSTEAHSTPEDALGIKFMHNYNRAQVAFNLRVVIQQPMAITRAALIINPKYITKALNAKKLTANIEDMLEHSGIAVWKDLGYYDINISRGLTQMIMQDKTHLDKITDLGLKPAEFMDKATWGIIWYACKLQLADQGITDYKQIEELFDEVIYRTQVVDSVLTKSQYMRDKGFFARASSAFMSESVTVASTVLSAYDDFQAEIRKGSSIGKAFIAHKKDIAKTMLVYSVSAIMLSVVQAVADAFRDDDDYEKWYEKLLEAFKGNLIDEFSPLNKLPLFKYIEELIKVGLDIFTDLDVYGNLSESAIAQWFDTLTKAFEITKEQLDGNSNYTLYAMIYKYFQVLSGISGIPASAAMREVITIWNNTFALLYPEFKITTYEPSDMSQIRYAYEDGYLTADEAVKEMFSLTSKGYSEENIRSQAKSQIGEWYSNDEISKQQTVNMLDRYFDMESDEIDANISYWDFKNDNPDIDVNIGWFEKYYSDIADSGISIDEYVDYRNKVKDITGEDKKSKRMKIINSLPISKSQKDALYLAEGWSESKLYEAPWH